MAYIALGSNVGDREHALAFARESIGSMSDTRILAESDIEETEPLGPVPQGKYLNQMVAVSTDLEPRTLLSALLDIERAAGRVRTVKWGPRTLDLDIVMIEGREYSDDVLTVPHPELSNREFWLSHLRELRGRTDG